MRLQERQTTAGDVDGMYVDNVDNVDNGDISG